MHRGPPREREAALGQGSAQRYRATFTAFFTTKLSLRNSVQW